MQFQNFKRFTRRVLSTVDDDGALVRTDLFIQFSVCFLIIAWLVCDHSYKGCAKTVCRYNRQNNNQCMIDVILNLLANVDIVRTPLVVHSLLPYENKVPHAY